MTLYWRIEEMRNRAKPWRSPAAGAQGDGVDIGVRRRWTTLFASKLDWRKAN